jgi:hypothetical protein
MILPAPSVGNVSPARTSILNTGIKSIRKNPVRPRTVASAHPEARLPLKSEELNKFYFFSFDRGDHYSMYELAGFQTI